MYFTAAIVASLVVSAHALATPHVAGLHRRHQHAVLAKARAPAPEPAAAAQLMSQSSANVSKRQIRKRCKPRKPVKSAAPAPVNVGSDPASAGTPAQSSEQSAPSPSSQKPEPSEKPAPPPPAPSKDDPKPSPSPKPAPKPSKPSQDPAPVTGGQSGSLFSGSQIGQGTFYGTGLGACGITNNDNDYIAAVSEKLFDVFPGFVGGNPNKNPVCGKKVRATYQGKSVEVTITDRCVACAPTDLDFSPKAFNQIADPAVGRISGMHWEWI